MLRPLLPDLSATYGLLPEHLPAMPRAELAEYVLDLIDRAEAAQRAADQHSPGQW